MDPISIAAGVAGTLSATLSVCIMLRKFLHGAKESKAVVNAMLADVKALRRVLESMELTFEEMDSERSETGSIGNHWRNLLMSLEDGQNCLIRLEKLLQDTMKEVKFLDTLRRQARLKSTTDQMALYRQEVQTYKDALHLSLQTITFYNQSLLKQDTTRLIANSETIQQDIQRLATNLDVKLVALEAAAKSQQGPGRLDSVNHLKATVTSAATVMSSRSTVVSDSGHDIPDIPDYMSDFGDLFQSESSIATLQWIYSDVREQPLFDFSTRITSSASVPTSPLELATKDTLTRGQSTVTGKSTDENRLGMVLATESKHVYSRPLPELPPTSLLDFLAQPTSMGEISRITRANSTVTEDSTVGNGLEMILATESKQLESGKMLSKPGSPRTTLPDFPPQPTSTNEVSPKRRRRFANLSVSNILRVTKRDEDPVVPKMTYGKGLKRRYAINRIKIVTVGDGACGKTCFLVRASKGAMPEVVVPTVFENYVMDTEYKGVSYELALWDTAGQEDYDRLRPLSYVDSHVILISFSIDSPDSLVNVELKWISEVHRFLSKKPIILVGMKADLRNDPETIEELLKTSQKPVTTLQAEEVSRQIGAVAYLECSAKTGEGCQEVMNCAISVVLEHEKYGVLVKRQPKGLISQLFRTGRQG